MDAAPNVVCATAKRQRESLKTRRSRSRTFLTFWNTWDCRKRSRVCVNSPSYSDRSNRFRQAGATAHFGSTFMRLATYIDLCHLERSQAVE